MSRIFRNRKSNSQKNTEAIDTFLLYNTLAPSTRSRYEKVIDDFGEFLVIHNKSLWDADFEDIKKFLLESDSDAARSILKTFYRILIDSGEFKSESPVVQYEKFLREREEEEEENKQPISKAESIIGELDEEDSKASKQTRLVKTERRKIGKRIITVEDLDRLTQQASHIRDRAILEFLYATGAQIQETINLNLADIDMETRQVTIHDNTSDEYRILILPKRTVNFLKIYERWRRRQMSPSQAYFITKTTRRRMSDSSISTWLHRIQGDVTSHERWTAMDFRKRALLQHYWVTRDLTAVARFGGYKRPESALNLISDILEDQGVDSIDKLASLPEFEQLKEDKRVAAIGDDQMTITIQLDKEEMDIIRNSGLTPTQAVKTIISLKDLYGAFGGGGGGAPSTNTKGTPSGGPNIKGAPSSGPNMKSSPGSGPNLKSSPGGGPNLKSGPGGAPNLKASPGGGPNLKSGPGDSPNLKSSPGGGKAPGAGGLDLGSVSLKSAPKKEGSPGGSGGPGGPPGGAKPPGGGGSPMSQLSELKNILAARRKKADAGEEEADKNDMPGPTSLGGRIEEADGSPISSSDDKKKSSDDDDDDEEDIPEMPDFNL